ncbi:MAG: zinc-binding alcohol dehydrogenase [Theionarchaea archaeon]|nr:zinc-binding alcohol dehydrogenase [Theionarchaea archaeon]
MRKTGIEYPSKGEMHFVDIGNPPEPGPNEVLIETEYSGITNGTERHALLGEHVWKGYFPSRHGYQHVGIIRSVGKDVQDLDEGDPVFYGHYVGHRGWNMQDMSAENHLVARLPPELDRGSLALLGVAGVAMRGVRRTRVERGHKVWVAGAGLIGQFATQSARAFGAEVTVSEPIPSRLTRARELGADRVLNPHEEGFEESLVEGGPYDRIIDTSGYGGLLDDIWRLRLLPHGGVIGLVAVRSETKFFWPMLHPTEGSIEVSCHFGLDDIRLLLDLIGKGTIGIDSLVSHREPIDNAPAIYRILRDSPTELLGVVFDWA